MRVRFWGTRGSIATPGPDTVRYGGNTSCVELRSASGTLVVLDCGTGARGLGEALTAAGPRPMHGHLLIGHTHWDHIQGLPFFAPLFVQGNEWDIYAPHGFEQSLHETLSGQMQYTYFPITLEQLSANIRYHEIVEGSFNVGDIRVTAQYLNHPALTLGYRLEADGVAVVYACDHEPHSRHLASGAGELTERDRRHVEFLNDADLVIHDAQYTAAEYDAKRGWGHSTVEYAVEVCRAAGVRRVALTHHDPMRNDDAVDLMMGALRQRVGAGEMSMELFAAAEGQVLELAADTSAQGGHSVRGFAAVAPSDSALIAQSVLLGVADPKTAATLVEALQADGIRTILAADGNSALRRALEEHPSLVILEYELPGIDGPSVCRAIRSSGHDEQGTARLPIVIVTDSEEDTTGSDADGVTDWLIKPFSTSYARTRVRALLLGTACRWKQPPVPKDEERRLGSLRDLGVLDTPPERRFDRLTRLAAAVFDVPVVLVSLVDRDRQWFKSAHGIGVRESSRETSFCAHAIVGNEPMVIPDALLDDRFADNPLVTGGMRVRFYAGQPLILPDGSCVGTLCLIDTRPRQLNEKDMDLLGDIGHLVRRELLLVTESTSLAEAKS
jgi:phosphoribosyl 1,2-cyclic phosphodiesterase/CheY-like chemotaxis protein